MQRDLPWSDSNVLAESLRPKLVRVDKRQVLLTRFTDTSQEIDITSGVNCKGVGRLHMYARPSARWPRETVPAAPAAARLGLQASRCQQAQLFQLAGCDYRCWYCFVDRRALAADLEVAEFHTAEELVELYLQEEPRPPVVVLTGGQPDLVPEWTVWMMDALRSRGVEDRVYLWQDDSLSCGYTWTYLTDAQRAVIGEYRNYGRICCLKSFCEAGFAETTGASSAAFDRHISLLKRHVEWGIDVYAYITLTISELENADTRMREFLDRIQSAIHPLLPLRITPLEIKEFTPTRERLTPLRRQALRNQYAVLEIWESELRSRFSIEERTTPQHMVRLH